MTDAAPEPALDADERTMLLGWLDYYRGVVLGKTDGLDRTALDQPLAPSMMTLGGLLKHLAYVEIWWFAEVYAGEQPGEPWESVDWDADVDWDWHSAAQDDPADLRAAYSAACERSRAICAAADLDSLSVRNGRQGSPFSLRWIVTHMIEETARHAGHADLLREAVDGQVG